MRNTDSTCPRKLFQMAIIQAYDLASLQTSSEAEQCKEHLRAAYLYYMEAGKNNISFTDFIGRVKAEVLG